MTYQLLRYLAALRVTKGREPIVVPESTKLFFELKHSSSYLSTPRFSLHLEILGLSITKRPEKVLSPVILLAKRGFKSNAL